MCVVGPRKGELTLWAASQGRVGGCRPGTATETQAFHCAVSSADPAEIRTRPLLTASDAAQARAAARQAAVERTKCDGSWRCWPAGRGRQGRSSPRCPVPQAFSPRDAMLSLGCYWPRLGAGSEVLGQCRAGAGRHVTGSCVRLSESCRTPGRQDARTQEHACHSHRIEHPDM